MRTTAALRRVARSVGASTSDAEDVAQYAIHAALRERAHGGSPGFGWIRAVARHRAIDWLRRADRRRDPANEKALDEHSANSPAPPELVQQFEVQRSLMAAVEALPDPYREVIFLRYFEEIGVPEIARRKGVPVATVRTWLTRAHRRLRERLLGPHEGRSPAWITSFWEFGRGPIGAFPAPVTATTPASLTIGSLTAATLLMSIKKLAIATLAVAVVGLGWRLTRAEDPTEGRELETSAASRVVPAVESTRMEPVDSTTARLDASSVPSQNESTATPVPVPAERVAVRGHVYDATGRPIAGMRVRVDPALPGMDQMVTSEAGSIEALTVLGDGANSRVLPAEPGMAVVLRQNISRHLVEHNRPALLVVALEQSIIGSAQGTNGEAVAGASIALELPEDFRTRFSEVLAWAKFGQWKTTSRADGDFELRAAPSLVGCSLVVSAEGYETAVLGNLPLAEERLSSGGLEVTLEPIDPLRVVRGVVLDASGDPVADARVGLGSPARRTDSTGMFEFELDGDDGASKGPQRLLATAPGWCPVEFTPQAAADGSIHWPDFVELRLERESLSIEGIVLDREGNPKEGVAVWVDDMTVIGDSGDGRMAIAENLEWRVSSLHLRYETDAAGRFRIEDLAPREYKVVAMDLATLERTEPTAITAGNSSAILRFDRTIELVDVSGRVISRAGAPLEGVSLEWTRLAHLVSQPGQGSARANFVNTDPVLTGPKGEFAFENVPVHGALKLHLSLKDHQPLDVRLVELGPPYADVEIVLGARCEVRVLDGGDARSIRLLDASGAALPLWSFPEPNTASRSKFLSLENGASLPFQVSDAAVEIEFFTGGEIVSSKAIRLKPGEINEVRR